MSAENITAIVNLITAIATGMIAILGAGTAFIVAVRPFLKDILAELRANRAELAKNTKVAEETRIIITQVTGTEGQEGPQ